MANDESVDPDKAANLIAQLLSGRLDAKTIGRLTRQLSKSIKITRKGVTLSGKSMADVMFLVAPKIPVRDLPKLKSQFGGMQGPSLAGLVIRRASRSSAAVGGAVGALASAGEFAPPYWVMLPVELVVETLLVACIEMKMIAEVHAVYGKPIEGEAAERGTMILESWAERRGVKVDDLASSGLKKTLSKNARAKLTQAVRRRLMIRTARNVSSLAPLFVGAALSAELNRRSTRDLGDDLVHDLSRG
jgi:hypothetical protein